MTDTKEDLSLNSGEEYWENLNVNDCSYLLRILEREAFSGVVAALRAKGPPSEHTFILLNQLKSALSINDELGRAEIRRAAFDAKLCKVSNVLNPNYDTCTEWSGCSMESRGLVEAGPSRGKPFANTSSTSIADQLLTLATTNNEKIDRSIGKSFELLCLPHKPYVPERLRLLLRETDRPEQRIAHPLEIVPVPTVSKKTVERSGRSEGRKVPIKKKRQRTSKGIKEKKLSELKAQTSPMREEGLSVQPVPPCEIASSLPIPTPITPLAVNAVLNLSSVVGSAGSTLISPGQQPPQSGDAMKTWVSKIHEQEMAASAAVNGIIPPPEETIITPSTSTTSTVDDSGKKKRRPRSAQVQDPYYLNSCARTRPFQFERAANGKVKPPRGNPDNSDSRSSGKLSPPYAQSGGSITPAHSVNTPTVRPHDIDKRIESNRNGILDVSPTVYQSIASTSVGANPSGYGSGGGVSSVNRPTLIQPSHIPPQYTSNSNLKRSHGPINSARSASKYYVNNNGVPVPTSSGTSNTVRTSSNTVGIGGRTSSLGTQQLSSMHGIPNSYLSLRASSSSANNSLHSTGGHIGSGMGVNSSPVHLNGDPSSNAEDYGGHDYGFTVPSSSNQSASTSHSNSGLYGGMRDTVGAIRITPRVVPRPRVTNSLMRSPNHHPTPHQPSNGIPLSPSLISLNSSSSPHPLQRAGSMSSMSRPRSGSRGSVVSIGGGGGTSMGERVVPNETVTDGIVQATVNTIMLEAAQKECANGKRSTVPRELLERENGGIHGHSPIAGSSIQSPQSSLAYSTIFRSPASVPTISSTPAGNNSHSITPTIPSSFPPINSTVSPLHPSLSSSLSTAVYNELLKSGGMQLLGSTTTSNNSIPPSNIPPNRIPSLQKKKPSSSSTPKPPAPSLCPEQIERILRIVHSSVESSSSQPTEITAEEDNSRSQSIQRQYVLQPEGVNNPDFNQGSSRSFASEGTSSQYSISRDELYDQGLLARPSTSGDRRGIGEFNGMSSGLKESQSSSHVFQNSTQHSSIMDTIQSVAHFGLTSLPSTELRNNGDMPSNSRDVSMQSYSSPLEQILQRPVVIPSGEERTSSEMKDILEQSCRELR